MNWDQIKGHWQEVSDKIKRTWGKFSEDDLVAIAGQREQLSGMLQEKYGYEKVEAERRVDQFARGINP